MRTILTILLAVPLVAAGCVSAPEELESAAADATDALAATDGVASPFTFDGSIGPVVVACPMVTCTGAAEGDRSTSLPFDGDNLTAVSLTMTWDAAAPHMETLRMGIAWGENGLEYVEGTSPLVLEVDGLEIAKEDEPYFWTWIVTPAPMGVAHVATPQDFHVEGTLTFTEAGA